MKYVLCGPFTNAESEKYLNVLPATGKFLYNLSRGLRNNGNEVINAIYVPYDIIDGNAELVKKAYEDEQLCVFRGTNRRETSKEYQDKILKVVDRNTVVIFYNMNYSLLGLYDKVKQSGARSLLIVADHGHSSACKNLKRKAYAMLCEREFKKFDKVITLSAETKIKFKPSASVRVMEGGINYEDFRDYTKPIRGEKIEYTSTGSLKPLLGVDMLLEAIAANPHEDFHFNFSGRGESVPTIKAASENDSRIQLYGFLSREEYTELMAKTNVFVSARNMAYEKNNNSFPSKILEYLATGRIIISTKFPGYEKFKNNILFYDGTTTQLLSLMDTISANYDTLSEKYFRTNREFAKEFDWNNQAKKIIAFME